MNQPIGIRGTTDAATPAIDDSKVRVVPAIASQTQVGNMFFTNKLDPMTLTKKST